VACATAGVALIDLKTPLSPKVSAWLPVKDTARGVSGAEGLAVVADGTAGISVFPLKGDKTSRPACRHKPRRSVNRVALSGDLALVANDHDGLLVLRVRPACAPGGSGKAEVLGQLPAPVAR